MQNNTTPVIIWMGSPLLKYEITYEEREMLGVHGRRSENEEYADRNTKFLVRVHGVRSLFHDAAQPG
jgi:hypothetical protein